MCTIHPVANLQSIRLAGTQPLPRTAVAAVTPRRTRQCTRWERGPAVSHRSPSPTPSRCLPSLVSLCSPRKTGELSEDSGSSPSVGFSLYGAGVLTPRVVCVLITSRGRGHASGTAAPPALQIRHAHQDPAHPAIHLILRVQSQQQVTTPAPLAALLQSSGPVRVPPTVSCRGFRM